MAHTYSHLLAHIIFSTKDRHPWVTNDIKSDLHAYLGGIIRQENSQPLSIGGIADHVHLLVCYPPRLAISDLVRTVKSNSSGWVHERWSTKIFQWQTGYAAFSVSESNRGPVTAYIENQDSHHRAKTFQEELLELLERHGVAYDPRYLWE
jgi:putative transposase